MKRNNIWDFFKAKKEIFLFIGILICLFGAIIAITNYADREEKGTTEPTTNPSGTTSGPTGTTSGTTRPSTSTSNDTQVGGDEEDETLTEKMILPIEGDFEIVLEYFDIDNPATLVHAVINTGSKMIESRGVSYAKEDNSVFPVKAIYSGEVVDIIFDEFDKYTVVVRCNDEVYVTYYSLSEVYPTMGEKIKMGESVGKAGESVRNTSAGVHVHIEIKKDGEFVNPKNGFGKKTGELIPDLDTK